MANLCIFWHSYTILEIITNTVMNINFNSNPIPVSKDFTHIYYIIQKNPYSNLYLSFSYNPEIKFKNYVVFKTYQDKFYFICFFKQLFSFSCSERSLSHSRQKTIKVLIISKYVFVAYIFTKILVPVCRDGNLHLQMVQILASQAWGLEFGSPEPM